jgi:GDPmannose 4,6-dehydratase
LNWQDYVSVDPAFYRPDEAVELVGSIDKAQKNLGWQPQYSFEQLIELLVDHDLKEITERGISR